jgi:hypothetical protein
MKQQFYIYIIVIYIFQNDVVFIVCVCFEKNEIGGACSTYGEKSSAYRILVGRPEGRRPLRRPRHRLEDNIKMDLQEVEWGMDWK